MNTAEDINLVEIWLRKDPVRWIAGVLAGLFAGVVSLVFAMGILKVFGHEMWLAMKYPALPVLGLKALELGINTQVILIGLAGHLGLCAFLGFVYAHFTGTNHIPSLFGMGLTWAAFTWVFVHNLFSPAWREVYVAQISAGGTFFVCIVFGISLTSVAFFDRLLRGFSK